MRPAQAARSLRSGPDSQRAQRPRQRRKSHGFRTSLFSNSARVWQKPARRSRIASVRSREDARSGWPEAIGLFPFWSRSPHLVFRQTTMKERLKTEAPNYQRHQCGQMKNFNLLFIFKYFATTRGAHCAQRIYANSSGRIPTMMTDRGNDLIDRA